MSAIAALPMYRVPDLEGAAESLWSALRASLRAHGLPAPETLTTDRPRMDVWRDDELLIGHTCGLPYAVALADRVSLVATPVYEVEGCAPGCYRSALVVRADDPRDTLPAFRTARAAYNERLSQSGYAALLGAVAPNAKDGRFFSALVKTGSHAASLAAVADGTADIAAIDAVTWRLAGPARASLRVLALTEPTPALPLIAAPRFNAETVRGATLDALAALDPATAHAYGLRGAVVLDRQDYAPLAEALARLEAAVHGRVAADDEDAR